MTEQIEADLRDAFARRAAEVPAEACDRLRGIDYSRPPLLSTARTAWRQLFSRNTAQDVRVPRRLILRAISAGGVISAGAVAAIILAAGQAPNAFAGWTAHPTAARSGQVQSAEAECRRSSALASLAPTVVDTRGPYTLLVYADASGVGQCVTGPSFNSPTGQPPFAPFHSYDAAPIDPNAIQRTDKGSVLTKTSPVAEFDFNTGRVGANVSGVTFVLEDGSRVQATVSNGWFAVDWPGGRQAQTAEITTTSGTTVQQQMPNSEPGG